MALTRPLLLTLFIIGCATALPAAPLSSKPSMRLKGGAPRLLTEKEIIQITSGVCAVQGLTGIIATTPSFKLYNIPVGPPCNGHAWRWQNMETFAYAFMIYANGLKKTPLAEVRGQINLMYVAWMAYQTFHPDGTVRQLNLDGSKLHPWIVLKAVAGVLLLGADRGGLLSHENIMMFFVVEGLVGGLMWIFQDDMLHKHAGGNDSNKTAMTQEVHRSLGLHMISSSAYQYLVLKGKGVPHALMCSLATHAVYGLYFGLGDAWKNYGMPNGFAAVPWTVLLSYMAYNAFKLMK